MPDAPKKGTIIGVQDTRFLIAAGTDPIFKLPRGRVYDQLAGKLGPPMLIGSITAHSPGWEKPTPGTVLNDVKAEVAKLL